MLFPECIKNVIKETWKNFKGEDEPKSRKKEKVRYDDYEEIREPEEKSQPLLGKDKTPTIIINNRPTSEEKKETKPKRQRKHSPKTLK
jgi:hypothetical protein